MRSMPCSVQVRPAGVSALIAPAGEMWSVVTESPSFASTRAPVMSVTGVVSRVMPSKYGGLRTYVESSFHSKVEPSGVGRLRHRSSPSNTVLYCLMNCSREIDESTMSCTSSGDGQMSLQEHLVAVRVLAQRVVVEVEVHRTGQRIRNDEGRRCEVVHLDIGADAALEVAVAREHRRHREVVVVDRLGDLGDQRAGVADADRAAVADRVEAEALEVLVEARLLVVVGDDLGARGRASS